jgi:hypothetical protein
MADAFLVTRQYSAAIEWARKALRQPGFQWSRHAVLISALGRLGHRDEAQQALAELLPLRPDFSIRFVRTTHLYSDAAYMAHYLDGLRLAGVPE